MRNTMAPTASHSRLGQDSAPIVGVSLAGAAALFAWQVAIHSSTNPDLLKGRIVAAVMMVIFTGVSCFALLSATTRESPRTMVAFRLGPFFLSVYLVFLGVMAIGWTRQQGGSASVVEQELIPAALGVIALGATAWTSGYVMGRPRFVMSFMERLASWAVPDPSELRFRSIAVVLFLLSAAARIGGLLTGGFAYLRNPEGLLSSPSSWNQLLGYTNSFGLYAVIIATIEWSLRPSFRTRMILYSILSAEFVFALVSGVKKEFLFTGLAVLMVVVLTKRTLPLRLIALGLVAFLLLIPVNIAYRGSLEARTEASFTATQGARSLPDAVRHVLQTPPAVVLGESIGHLGERIRLTDSVAIVMQRTPSSIAYQGWRSLALRPLIALVPRFVWPSKPVISYGYEFGLTYFGRAQGSFSSTAVTLPGDLYRYGGVLAVVVGMFLLGAFVRPVSQALYSVERPGLLVLYIPLFFVIVDIEPDVTSYIGDVVQTLAILLVIARIAFVSSPTGRF